MSPDCLRAWAAIFAPEAPAAEDSAIAARLRRAGAIILGKTNTPEFLGSYETDNYITGRANDPWNVERTPGGSSGGEAAAIASGCSPGGVGSDGGGSVRVPAHFCGIAGLKPTPGRISLIGHRPAEAATGIAVAGPMARSVADVRLLFEVLAAYDDRDPLSAPVELRSPMIEQARVGVFETFYDAPVQPAIRRAVREAAALLAGLGFKVDEFRPEGLERAPNLWSFFFAELPARASKERIAGREEQAHWTYTENLNRILERPPASGWQVMESLRDARPHAAQSGRADAKYPVPADARLEHRRFPSPRAQIRDGIQAGGTFSGHDAGDDFQFAGISGIERAVYPG